MTKELCDLPDWNLDRLQVRHKKLKAKAIELWGIPSS